MDQETNKERRVKFCNNLLYINCLVDMHVKSNIYFIGGIEKRNREIIMKRNNFMPKPHFCNHICFRLPYTWETEQATWF